MQFKEGASENCFLKKAVSVIHLSLTMGFLILIPHEILPKLRILRVMKQELCADLGL